MLLNPYRFGGGGGGPTDPYFSNVQLLIDGNGTNGSTTIPDFSTAARTVSVTGNAAISTAQSAFAGSSIAFDGAGDSVQVPHASSLNVSGTTDFTFECMVYLNNLTVYHAIFSRRDGLSSAGGEWQLYMDNTNDKMTMGFNTFGTTYTPIQETTSRTSNTWFAICVERSGSTVRMYIDGIVRASGTVSGALLPTTGPVILGAAGSDLDAPLNGYMQAIRYTIGVARYNGSAYTPPTANWPHS